MNHKFESGLFFKEINLMVATINPPPNFDSIFNNMWEHSIEFEDINQIDPLFTMIVDNLPDFIWIKNSDNKFVYANKTFLRFLDIASIENYKGKDDGYFLDSLRAKNKIERMAFDFSFDDINVPVTFPVRQQIIGTINSDLFAMDIQKTPISNKNKLIIGYAFWGRNVSELYKQITYRFKTQEDLTQTRLDNFKIKDLNNAIIHNVDAFIYVKDKDGKFISANKKFYDYFKTDSACIKGCDDFDFYLKDVAEKNSRIDRIVMTTNQSFSGFEDTMVDFDGIKHHVLTSKSPLHDSNGNVIGLVGITFNIDKQKEIEENLKFSNDIYLGTLNSVPDAIIITNPNGEILDFNNGTKRIFGYNNDQLKNKIKFVSNLFVNPLEFDKNAHKNDEFNSIEMINGKKLVYEDYSNITKEVEFPCEYNSYMFLANGKKMVCHWISDRTIQENMRKELDNQKREMIEHYTTIIVDANKQFSHLFIKDDAIEIKISGSNHGEAGSSI